MGLLRCCGIALLGLAVAGAVWGQRPHSRVRCPEAPPGDWNGPGFETHSIEAATATPTITVMRYGKAIAGAQIEISLISSPQGRWGPALTTDAQGQAVLPRLIPGAVYEVVARFEDDASDELDLQYLASARQKTDAFRVELDLVPDWSWPGPSPSRHDLVAAAIKKGSEQAVSAFQGAVRDDGMAIVPNAAMEVYDGNSGKFVMRLSSDEAGRFSASLPDGNYVVIVRSDSYEIRTIAFSVMKAGVRGELKVALVPTCIATTFG
jgi:hypothetical protein